MNENTNELDISIFFSSLYSFFYKNAKLLVLSIILGVILGLVYDKMSKPYYTSVAYATSALSYFETEQVDYKSKKILLDQQAMVDIINDISRLVNENEMDVVAIKLNVPLEVAQSIRFIEAEELFYVDGENIQQKRDKFQIVLESFDNGAIRDIQNGLEYYINNNAYINKYYQLYLDQSNQLVDRISREIDDLKQAREQQGSKPSGDYSEIKLGSQYAQTENQIVNLFIKQQQINKYATLFKPIEFFEVFSVPEKPTNRLFIRMVIMSALFFMLGIFIGLIRYFNSSIKTD